MLALVARRALLLAVAASASKNCLLRRSPDCRAMWSHMGTGTDQASLVRLMEKTGRVRSRRVADTLRAVDRRFFVAPGTSAEEIYMVCVCFVVEQRH
jgi:hypothetical protein